MIDMEMLKNSSQLRTYKTGTLFCKDGVGNDMYILVQGKVAVLNSSNRRMVAVIGPGDYFNEFLVFSDEQTHLSTVALTDVTVLPMSKFGMPTFVAEEPRLTCELMKAMYERFVALNNEFETATGRQWVPKMPAETEQPAETAPKAPSNPVSGTAPQSTKKGGAVSEPTPAPSAETLGKTAAGTPSVILSHENCSLFPEGHTGNYELKLTKADNTRMCEIEYTCPVCGSTFKGLKILSSRLGASTSDPDTRKHYKGFDPIYYEVVTCPFCLFSALANMFNSVEDVETDFLEALQTYHNYNFKFGTDPDTAAVFAGYYLALQCAPQCFNKPQLIEASLLHKLSWLYHDCKDEELAAQFRRRALDMYLKGYVELAMSADKEVQLCMIIGELSYEDGNIKDAKNYYYKAKMNPTAPAVLKRRAGNRLEDLKEYEQAQTESESSPEPESDDGRSRRFKRAKD